MKHRMPGSLILCFVPLVLASCSQSPSAETTPQTRSAGTVPLTRLFFQDHKTCSLRWADVQISRNNQLTLTEPAPVKGFKKLDATKQKLVQMREINGTVLVGIRDDKDGAYESGWVLLHTGVIGRDHGDHVDWSYRRKPTVLESCLNEKQGNPAHVYVYDQRFFVANDKLNGYTRIDPSEHATQSGTKKGGNTEARFMAGGGNHITLAVVDDKVGYSCWIDGGGPNKGRVDVTRLTSGAKSAISYSFHLPTGVIHGATASSGKVFFAPADGICWTQADLEGKLKPSEVKIHHIDLGKDDGKPRRVGAFENHRHWVLFVTGKGATSTLMLLDARSSNPMPIKVPLSVKKGTRAVTPFVATTAAGRPLAFIFHDHVKDADVEDALEIIDLDPNGDDDCKDAKVIKRLKVGNSAVEGHFGHHDITVDADGRYAFFTNPGDGTISALSLKDLKVVATVHLGGMPTSIVARGGQEIKH